MEHYPDAQDAWFRLGYVRLQLEEFPACLNAFETCLALPKKCPEALLNIGVVHWKMRNLEIAKAAFRQCLGSASKPRALRLLASIALLQQDYETALALHFQLLELEEKDCDVLYNLALLLQKRGRTAEAVRFYREVLALRPDFQEAALNLGHALMGMGKHEEARVAWQSTLRGNADLAEQFLV